MSTDRHAIRRAFLVILSCFGCFLTVSANARADVSLALLPSVSQVSPGGIVDVELTITDPGSAFNGYDAVVGFDPEALTFIELTQAEQEGPLMTEACAQRFHVFSSLPAGDTVIVNHVLLCSGVSVTGPGVLYRLRFEAKDQLGLTEITLLPGTGFFLAGAGITPVLTEGTMIQVSPITDVPSSQAGTAYSLRAEPNPFNPRTVLSFELSLSQTVSLDIIRLDGRRIRSLIDRELSAGPHRIVWDGRDDRGRAAGSGIYRAQLTVGDQQTSLPITLVR